MTSPIDPRGTKIDILDHGFVRLVDFMGNDTSIVRAARCSYAAADKAGEDPFKDAKLIKRLWRDQHHSPFEAVTATIEIYAPIFTFRQIHRHRTFAYSELSGRFRELPEVFYLPRPEDVGVQSQTNKQGRNLLIERDTREAEIAEMEEHCKRAFDLYHRLLKSDWPRESARTVLPLATYSHMFMTGCLRNWLHFLDLRLDPHAQFETRQIAGAVKELWIMICPVTMDAWANPEPAP